MVSQENSKQTNKVSESQYMLQKTNTNHSADENQLTAPSPTQITKKEIKHTGRKRSIFNTDNSTPSQQQLIQQDLNRSHHSPPSLHSPNFPQQNQGMQNFSIPQLLSNKSNSFKSVNGISQINQSNGTHSPISPYNNQPQNQIPMQQNQRKHMSFNPINLSNNNNNFGQSNLNSFYSAVHQPQLQQSQQQLIEMSPSPSRSPIRQGSIIQNALFQSVNTLNRMQSNNTTDNAANHIQNISQQNYYQFNQGTSLPYQNQGQVNPTTPSNNLNNSNNLKSYPSQTPQDKQQSTQVINSRTFSSLSATREREKSTSMERQNLVMRTRLQQNIRRSQLSYKDQVFSAIKENNIHEIEDLLNQNHSLTLESKDEDGNTFIIIAAQVGSKEIVEYLFQKGADINAQNNDGDTALHRANFYQYHSVADFLIQNGSQQNKLNNNGMNPWGCFPSSSKR